MKPEPRITVIFECQACQAQYRLLPGVTLQQIDDAYRTFWDTHEHEQVTSIFENRLANRLGLAQDDEEGEEHA